MKGDKGPILLKLAREAIGDRLGLVRLSSLPPKEQQPWLYDKGASFVTLKKFGRLRGCIGSIKAYRPLYLDVRENAVAAAFQDPRFPPVVAEEFDDLLIEVSVLTPPMDLPVRDEAELGAKLRPGVDGVILSYGVHRATFLPQVWEELPDPSSFLAHLKMKAGLPPDFWDEGIHVQIYQVEKYTEVSEGRS